MPTICQPVANPRTGGRVAFAAQSVLAFDAPADGALRPLHCDGTTRCALHARQSDRFSADARLRFEYSCGSRPVCALCLLPGTFALERDHAARLVISHTVSVARGGSNSVLNVHGSHVACNAAAGDRDLSSVIPAVTRDLPTLKASAAWARTPHRTFIPKSLPTREDMAQARDARDLPDGTTGLGF